MVFTCLYGNDQCVFVHVRHFLFACGKLPVHCKGSAGRRCGYGIFEEGISDERIAEIGSLIEKEQKYPMLILYRQMQHGKASRMIISENMQMASGMTIHCRIRQTMRCI